MASTDQKARNGMQMGKAGGDEGMVRSMMSLLPKLAWPLSSCLLPLFLILLPAAPLPEFFHL